LPGSSVEHRDASTKLARKRLSVLELAMELGSVSKACRQAGMDRTSFYEWRRRFQTHGLSGLKDLPPIHRSHPQTTPQDLQDRICDMSLSVPAKGCKYISDLLALEGIRVSSVTVQAILNKRGLGHRLERLMEIEKRALDNAFELTEEMIRMLEKANPCFAERHVESSRPGELLSQDNFLVGSFKGIGKVYLHTVVDTYGSVAFGVLGTSKKPEWAVSVLANDVLPFYKEREIPVERVLTDNGREFCGTDAHHYELFLALAGIEHATTRVRRPQSNGFVERFHRTVLDEFFRVQLRNRFYDTLEELQEDLDEWMHHYNHERPHQGYRNMGRRPIDTVRAYQGSDAHKALLASKKAMPQHISNESLEG
jgi:transposase InsO family protein